MTKNVTVKLNAENEGKVIRFAGVTDIDQTDHRLRLYRQADPIAQFDMADVATWLRRRRPLQAISCFSPGAGSKGATWTSGTR